MPRKQQLSGSTKRKLKEQREALAVCKKVPKITDWASKVNVNQQPLEAEHGIGWHWITIYQRMKIVNTIGLEFDIET